MAKVLIDMPTDYRFDTILGAIQNGIVLDNFTNGEVIRKMFPYYDVEVYPDAGYVRVFYENFYTTYPLAWWNRKWGE